MWARAGEIEAWGRGIQRIFQACCDTATPEPQLRLAGHDLWLEFAFASDYVQALTRLTAANRSPKRAEKLR